jgi:hypothetical protein
MKKLTGLLIAALVAAPGCYGALIPVASAQPNYQLAELPDAGPTKILRSGTFVTGEHKTAGTVNLVKAADGRYYVELDKDFTTDKGPDLFVLLHRSPDLIKTTQPPNHSLTAGDYVLLSPLVKTKGFQRYILAGNINPEDFNSVAIWCRQFNATFGAATLKVNR